MAIGVSEVIVIAIVGTVGYLMFSNKQLPKDKVDKLKANIKSTLKDVKEMEYDIRETVEEVEQEVKKKKKNKFTTNGEESNEERFRETQ